MARDGALLAAYLHLFQKYYDGALLIPVVVLTEVRSGLRSVDVLTDRLMNAIGGDDAVMPLTTAASMRAGVLRAEAIPLTDREISTTDAQIVAMAEERSFRNAVTIVTGDPKDIELLVGLTRRPNIAVDVPA